MGTSRSKPDAPPLAPLVPPWADADPTPSPIPDPLPEEPVPEPEGDPGPPADEVAAEEPPDAQDVAEPKRFLGVRLALGRFASSGNTPDARAALGRWANTSVGGARAAGQRSARAARTGGAVLAGLGRAGAGAAPEPGAALDIRTLAGLSAEAAIAAIVDAFMPPGIIDEVAARLAMEEALAEALGDAETFDPAAIDGDALQVVTLAYVSELVSVQVAGDAGRSLANAGPAAAAQREADIRSLVREVTDFVGGPLLAAQGPTMTTQGMAALVTRVLEATVAEMGGWDDR